MSRVYASGNLLKINLTKNTIIILDFADNQEAKQALLRLQSQFNLIKNRVISDEKQKEQAISQVQDSLDFTGLYQSIISSGTFSGSTASGTASGTASTSSTIESRLFALVQKIGSDVVNINDKVTRKVIFTYSPTEFYSEETNQHQDVLGFQFDFESQGDINIYVNGVLVLPGDNEGSIAYFSDNSYIKSTIFNGSRLYLNPYLLGYSLDESDRVSIECLKQVSKSSLIQSTTTTTSTTKNAGEIINKEQSQQQQFGNGN